VFGGVGVHSVFKVKRLRRSCTTQTEGLVVDFVVSERSSTDNDDGETISTVSYIYYPVFSYYASGAEYKPKSSVGTGRKRFSEGDKVTVFYNPSAPAEYYILEDSASKRLGYYFMGFGILTLLVLIGVLIFND
jgi:hypothetical protein